MRLWFSLATILAIICAPFAGRAQSTAASPATARICGFAVENFGLTEPKWPLHGVPALTLHAESRDSGKVVTTTTDASGHYCFILPVPGRYRISGGREISYIRVLTADPVEVAIDSGNEYLALLKVWLGIRMIDRAPSDLVRPSQAADYSALHPSSIELQRAPQTLDQALSAVPGVLAAPSLPQAPLPH